MRTFVVLLALFASQGSWANGQRQLEQLASQVAILWDTYRPVCKMGLSAEQQARIEPRLLWLESKLGSEPLLNTLNAVHQPKLAHVWSQPAWQRMTLLEGHALQNEQRENLREYLFKLQTNQPNATRQTLITKLQQSSLHLNTALRKGLWKTCHALAMEGMASQQIDALLESRWQKQSQKVVQHLEQELSAFYFFSYRQISNEELQQFALLQAKIAPWTEVIRTGIDQYFAQLHLSLMSIPMSDITHLEPIDEPFPSSRPWHPTPSQPPFQP